LEFLKQILEKKLFKLWTFKKNGEDAEDVGGFTPFAVMHQEKIDEVEDSNKKMNDTLNKAIKKLIS